MILELLAYSPTTASLARRFGYVPPTLRLPSPATSLSPLADTPLTASAGVGLASIPPQQKQPPRSVSPYKGSPPTRPLLSSTPSPYSSQRFRDESPPSIGTAGVGLFTPSPAPTPPQQLGITPHRATPSPQSIGTAGVDLSSPISSFSSPSAPSSTPRRRPTVRRQRKRRRTSSSGTTSGSTTSSARSRVARIRNSPTTRRRVQSLQRSADHAVRGRKVAAVTETRTVATTYKGNNHLPRVTRVSTRQTSPSKNKEHIHVIQYGHAHLQKGCRRGWIETRIFCVYCLRGNPA